MIVSSWYRSYATVGGGLVNLASALCVFVAFSYIVRIHSKLDATALHFVIMCRSAFVGGGYSNSATGGCVLKGNIFAWLSVNL